MTGKPRYMPPPWESSESHQKVIRWSLDSHQTVIKWSLEINQTFISHCIWVLRIVLFYNSLPESQCDGNFQTSANISANHKTNCCELTYFWLVDVFVEGQNFCQTGRLLYKSTIELKVEVLGWKRYFEYHDQTFCIFIFFLPLDNVYVATDASLHFTRLRFLLPTLKIWLYRVRHMSLNDFQRLSWGHGLM